MPIGAFKLNTISMAVSSPPASESYWISRVSYPSNSNIGYAVDVDTSGNIYVTGETVPGGVYQAYVFKMPSSGDSITWTRYAKASSTGTCLGIGVAVDSSGNVYQSAKTSNAGGGYNMAIFSKWNSSGTFTATSQWINNATSTNFSIRDLQAVGTTIYSTGTTYVGTGTVNALFIGKWSNTTTLTWGRYITTSNSGGSRIAVDSSENVIAIASQQTSGQTAGGQDFFIVKYNSAGTLQWQKTIGTTAVQYGSGVAVDTNGDIYITGIHNNGTKDTLFIAKVVSAGTSISWQKNFDATNGFVTGDNFRPSIAIDSSNNVYVSGTSQDASYVGSVFIAKYNSSGTLQWKKSLQYNAANTYMTDIKISSNGLAVIVTGFCTVSGVSVCFVTKLPTDGTLNGTYSSWVYGDSALTEATPALAITNRTAANSTQTTTAAGETLSNGNITFTNTKATIA